MPVDESAAAPTHASSAASPAPCADRARGGDRVRAGRVRRHVDGGRGRQAGVTRLIVYRIFETKEDLYRAVLEDVAERLTRRVGETAPTGARGPGRRPRPPVRRRGRPGRLPPLLAPLRPRAAFCRVPPRFLIAAEHMRTPCCDRSSRRPRARRGRPTRRRPPLRRRDRLARRRRAIRDAEFVEMIAAGVRALVTAWSA